MRSSLALGHIPQSWRVARAVFIPKPGKLSYTEPKSYRPICLSSFLLKTMEKIILRQIWDGPLKRYPLHQNQHAYIAGRSCESALHQVVSKIEKALEFKEVALAAFLDIQGAFDCTRLQFIMEAVRDHGVSPQVCGWVEALLRQRLVSMTHLDTRLTVRTTRGSPQGGVLSPLLWNLVVDGLLRELDESGVFVQG